MPGDISFSGSEILLITGIVTALATPIGILFWALIGAMKDQIKREQDLVDKLGPVLERVASALEQEIAQSTFMRQQMDRRAGSSTGGS